MTLAFTCGYCSADDMSRYDTLKHLSLTHDLVVKTDQLPHHTRQAGAPLIEAAVAFHATWRPSRDVVV